MVELIDSVLYRHPALSLSHQRMVKNLYCMRERFAQCHKLDEVSIAPFPAHL
jgi:hypothetical protein